MSAYIFVRCMVKELQHILKGFWSWSAHQEICVKWSHFMSAILSPFPFNRWMDDLLKLLSRCGTGCMVGNCHQPPNVCRWFCCPLQSNAAFRVWCNTCCADTQLTQSALCTHANHCFLIAALVFIYHIHDSVCAELWLVEESVQKGFFSPPIQFSIEHWYTTSWPPCWTLIFLLGRIINTSTNTLRTHCYKYTTVTSSATRSLTPAHCHCENFARIDRQKTNVFRVPWAGEKVSHTHTHTDILCLFLYPID